MFAVKPAKEPSASLRDRLSFGRPSLLALTQQYHFPYIVFIILFLVCGSEYEYCSIKVSKDITLLNRSTVDSTFIDIAL